MTHQKVYVIFMIGFIFVVIIGKSMIIFFRVFFKTLFFTLRNLLRVIFKHLSNIFRQFVCRINGEPYVSDNKLEEQEIDSDDSDEEIKMQ